MHVTAMYLTDTRSSTSIVNIKHAFLTIPSRTPTPDYLLHWERSENSTGELADHCYTIRARERLTIQPPLTLAAWHELRSITVQ